VYLFIIQVDTGVLRNKIPLKSPVWLVFINCTLGNLKLIKPLIGKTMATTIDPVSAKGLIKEYQQQNAADGGPALKTPDGSFLNGFFIDRESLERMLQNPKATGISIHLAKHPDFKGSKENHITLLYSAAEPNATTGAAPYTNSGEICGDPPPCPPICSNITGS